MRSASSRFFAHTGRIFWSSASSETRSLVVHDPHGLELVRGRVLLVLVKALQLPALGVDSASVGFSELGLSLEEL